MSVAQGLAIYHRWRRRPSASLFSVFQKMRQDIKRSGQESLFPPPQISDRAGCGVQICGCSEISDGRKALVRFMLGGVVESG